MTKPNIKKIKVQGFRSFGKAQTFSFNGPIAVVWGFNSQGKTSFAEAIEFLLTGKIVRRDFMAGVRSEFSDALRNAHFPPNELVFIEAEIIGSDGNSHILRRTLTSDYTKQQDCLSKLEINDVEADEGELSAIGIVLSSPPLVAPVLAQHTLGYLFSAGPQERTNYFKTALEVIDLEELRNTVVELGKRYKFSDDPIWNKFINTTEVLKTRGHTMSLEQVAPHKDDIAITLNGAVVSILKAAGVDVPTANSDCVSALSRLLSEQRQKVFPVDRFKSKTLADWSSPDQSSWVSLNTYIQKCTEVDKQTRQLMKLFKEALAIPTLKDAREAVDCLLCGNKKSFKPERVLHLQDILRKTEAFQSAEGEAIEVLRSFNVISQSLVNVISSACPDSLNIESTDGCELNFSSERIREILNDEDKPIVDDWLNKLRELARIRTSICAKAESLNYKISGYIENLDSLETIDDLSSGFAEMEHLYSVFSEELTSYSDVEGRLAKRLTTVIDIVSNTEGWQSLIDLIVDLDGLKDALIKHRAHKILQEEIAKAVQHIDRGAEKVLNDKFIDLSEDVRKWWNLLRPDESTFFYEVKPRERRRRTIDFKAGLVIPGDSNLPKFLDVVAVFSQSQFHCLGLALFLARSVRENTGFIILDDPILTSDEEHRDYFESVVLENLIDIGIQTIILTQDRKLWRDIEHRYLHKSIDIFQISLTNPAEGTLVDNKGNNLEKMLSDVKTLVDSGQPDHLNTAGEKLRDAAERFCKQILVEEQWSKGNKCKSISDYDRKSLKEMESEVISLLNKDSSHPGKLMTIRKKLNPASHDDDILNKKTLNSLLGELRYLKEQYVGLYKHKSTDRG